MLPWSIMGRGWSRRGVIGRAGLHQVRTALELLRRVAQANDTDRTIEGATTTSRLVST